MNTKVNICALACLFAFTMGEQCRHRGDCSTKSCERPVFVDCIDHICTCAVPTHVAPWWEPCTKDSECETLVICQEGQISCKNGRCFCNSH
ncbi:Hypothetical predicted protein [Mytilus galloprovincialis]|uniref:Uncharacterized protein n=1 Tax=Mytilus galloprovincialis TaxID=29158 RepID=A0A8B6H7K7_MYTGA|nr:Hypothetical predicted protein [Mytilus galloprovincialis]